MIAPLFLFFIKPGFLLANGMRIIDRVIEFANVALHNFVRIVTLDVRLSVSVYMTLHFLRYIDDM